MADSTYAILNRLQNSRLSSDPLFKQALCLDKSCNRYSDIAPFVKDQVKLDPTLAPGGYINASYCSSLRGHFRYIAAQGPLPSSVTHFWEMVWQEKCPLIVMLTPLVENKRVKCHQYWPEDSLTISPQFNVHFTGQKQLDHQLIQRSFTLIHGDERRTVEQLHFEGWADHADSDVNQVIQVLKSSLQIQKNAIGTPIVHCSAGVGRTGTFLTISSLYTEENKLGTGFFYDEDPIGEVSQLPYGDLVANTVNHLRRSRIASVQTIDQFSLCYKVASELKVTI
jgi:protein tyrosine phosphatase